MLHRAERLQYEQARKSGRVLTLIRHEVGCRFGTEYQLRLGSIVMHTSRTLPFGASMPRSMQLWADEHGYAISTRDRNEAVS